MAFLCVWIDLQLSASFLTAIAYRLSVLPAACVIVRGRILEAHPLAGTMMCKGSAHTHAASGKQKQDVIREKLPSRGFKSYTHTLTTPQGAVLRQGPTTRVLVEGDPISTSRVLCMFLDYGAKRQLCCC